MPVYKIQSFHPQCIQESDPPYTILSIDDGGIRGIIPATLLSRIEERVQLATSEMFHCLAGSSTGGIFSLGLSRENPSYPKKPLYQARDILQMYKVHASEIFERDLSWKVSTLWGGIGSKYCERGIEKILQNKFENTHLDESLTDLVVTSFDVQNRCNYIFKNFVGLQGQGYLMSDVARSTSAAPTYFPSKQMRDFFQPDTWHNFIDGGITANNPSEWAFLECSKYRNLQKRKVFVLSIGTGEFPRPSSSPQGSKNWGLLQWAPRINTDFFEASSQSAEQQMQLLSETHDVHYLRLQPSLESPSQELLDNTDPENMSSLENTANDYFDKLLQEGFDEKVLGILRSVPHQQPLVPSTC